MSGFDFGALRDPDAPQPDSRHRDGVEARAHELRAKARRNRAIVSALALAVVVAAVGGIVATRPDEDQVIVRNPSSTTAPPPSSIGDRFVPPTTTANGMTTLPVTLPDGETFTLRYPVEMKIAQLGFAGGIGVDWPVEDGALHCCGKVVGIRYTTVGRVYGDAKPVKVYRGADGSEVRYFHGSQSVDPPISVPLDYLVFQFGPWLVQVYDVQRSGDNERRMTDEQRATWARSLSGTLDANGYLMLHASAPLSVGNGFDGTFGTAGGNVVEVASHLYCGQPESDTNVRRRFTNNGEPGVSWCAGDLHVSATGTNTFVDLAADELQISPLGRRLTNTVSSTAAVSASFISPQHGWVLQGNGDLSATTDGGRTWNAVGSLQMPASGMKIRYADASHGFAFQSGGGLFATDDGGAHWRELDAPFSEVTNLAISHGSVYAVASVFGDQSFGIWSTPVHRSVWTRDPLALPFGAFSVSTQQVVLAGTRGWILSVNRTVIAGAELSANGTWAHWEPPCRLKGPAFLSASTGTDLVAVCQDDDPETLPAVYFSHDGGATFQRHAAPIYGEVASPDPNTAVIVDADSIQRTTDDGTTWHSVYSGDTGSLSDLGFTTPTQGFVMRGGEMLMTYDAGATWSAVTLP
jgi:hypothetical protein